MAQYTMMWIFSKLFRHFYVQRSHVEMLKAAQEVSVLKVNVVVMLSPSLFLPFPIIERGTYSVFALSQESRGLSSFINSSHSSWH